MHSEITNKLVVRAREYRARTLHYAPTVNDFQEKEDIKRKAELFLEMEYINQSTYNEILMYVR